MHIMMNLSQDTWVLQILQKIQQRYYWQGLNQGVVKYVKICQYCKGRKEAVHLKPVGLLQPIQVGELFERIGIDLLDPFPKSKQENDCSCYRLCYSMGVSWSSSGW